MEKITMENQREKQLQVSIIFPVCNEEDNLEELVNRCSQVLKNYYQIADLENQREFELILVDDGSCDRSLEIFKRLASFHSFVKFLHHEVSRGQTGAFKSGFDEARGKIIITMDADLEVLPEDIPLFLNKMKEGHEMVNAVRADRRHERLINLQSKIYNILMRIFFSSPFKDNASNYTALLSSYAKNLPLTDNDHRYLYPIFKSRGLKKCAEVEVRHQLRKKGVSKYSRLKAIKSGFEIIPAYIRVKTGYYKLKT